MDDSGTTGTINALPAPLAAFILTKPEPSLLTAPLTTHFTALSAHSTLHQLHSIHRSSLTATAAHSDSSPVPLYRLTTSHAHKRQKRQQPSATASSSSSSSSSTAPPWTEQPVVEHVLAFHTASSISLPLLSFTLTQLRAPLLVALVDNGQSVTVLRLQDGIVPHPSHGKLKKSKAAVTKAAAARTAAAASSASSGDAHSVVTSTDTSSSDVSQPSQTLTFTTAETTILVLLHYFTSMWSSCLHSAAASASVSSAYSSSLAATEASRLPSPSLLATTSACTAAGSC